METRDLSNATIAVIGSGTMGIGIAQLAAMHGHTTYLFDVDVAKSQAALASLESQLAKRVQKGKMSQVLLDSTLEHLFIITDINEMAAVQLIVEAIVERQDIKQQLFVQLADICANDTIFASNTSSISITAIASAVPNPERVVGLHFFNPAPVMKLVEIVRGLRTATEITDGLFNLMSAWKKVPVIAKSTPGFIVNRVARPYYAEGFRALQENATTPAQLDFIMRESGRFAMGPCELTDLIGQDVNFSVTQSVYQAFFYEPRYRPSLVQKELVDAGCFGRKSGQGFYEYSQTLATPAYTLPTVEANDGELPTIIVRGDWLYAKGLVERLQAADSLTVTLENADQNSIEIGDVSIRLSLGESVVIDHGDAKVMLMDWHADWSQACAVVLAASMACNDDERELVTQAFARIDVHVIWTADHPGLYVLRTIAMLINEGCEAVLHNIASEADIDAAMKYGVNYPQGPFEWAQMLGYDTVLNTLNNLQRIYGEERYRASLYLVKKAVTCHTASA
ncbi:3-hydroxyacyl-CoA dehydrogenase PaaC [Psychrobacter sp. JCM 18902]|uniref:3-hydroxyacyl-CoA dehydrogenase n=1 Tax=Psychrobacter sp. JCM 18902 TaxID=1298607 RepID=UPI0004362B12|nr:3-hydroxyacyl-CoA dehydrogenase [Psychrobacter sp. JCM 18902]GAF59683.1 3-hydroxyacyl-CoA dehydrogenase PaaC [Psychrobacter sp. JCM 18902]